MVKETRFLTLRKGLNHLEFSWANTLIDPTSVEFKALTHADGVEVLDASFPPRVTNTLEWSLQSEFAGEVQLEIRYFTSGISWSADYVLEAARDEKTASLAGFVTVRNKSGEDYENAQIRLVVGVVRLVEDIDKLARAAKPTGPHKQRSTTLEQQHLQFAVLSAEATVAEGAVAAKEELSEYFLHTVKGRDTVPNGWSKRLPSLNVPSIPLASYDKFDLLGLGDHVLRYYKFTNSVAGGIGREPLPDGNVIAFRSSSADQLRSLVGQTSVKYIPVNEEVEMDLGNDQEVLVEPVLADWRKDNLRFDKDGNVDGWTITQTWRLETRNSREIPVTLDIRRNFEGDWTVKTDAPYEKVDARKIKFVLNLAPREKKTFTYEVVENYGASATR
jgi:hypothetical protein